MSSGLIKVAVNDKLIILDVPKNYRKELVDYFTFDDISKAFSGGQFDAKKIKKVKLIRKKNNFYYLYSGFIFDLIRFLKRNDIKFEIINKTTKFSFQKKEYNDLDKYFKGFNYYEHQLNALKKMIPINKGIIKMPTSSGKSKLMNVYLKIAKLKSLIIVNRVGLAVQIYKGLEKDGFKNVGLFYGKSSKNGDVVVATIGSVKKIPDIHKFKILLIDEVHHAKSKQYQEFLENTSFPIRFGFSATPEPNNKLDWARIRQFLGEIIYEAEVDELIENKVIAKPKINFIDVYCVPTLDWPSANEYGIILNEERNNKIKDLIEKHNLQTLVLVNNLKHGEILEDLIEGSFFLNGSHNPLEREEIVEKFTNKEIQTIIATSIFNEGISINAIDLLILASGRKSKIETLQKLGRGLRTRQDKKEVLVYDFYDYGNRFTQRHSNLRKNLYKRAGFEVIESP